MVINLGWVKEGQYDKIPVSYTHLDVYKRQGVECPVVNIFARDVQMKVVQVLAAVVFFVLFAHYSMPVRSKSCLLYTSRCV